mgnify:CR=1 FL=1
MSWNFENAAPVIGSITEGNAWDGELMLYSNISMNRIMSYDPDTGLVEVWREDTEGTNGLNFDTEGRLFGCAGDGRSLRTSTLRLYRHRRLYRIIQSLAGRRQVS